MLESQTGLGATEPGRTLATAECCDKDHILKLLSPTTKDKMLVLKVLKHSALISYQSWTLFYSLRVGLVSFSHN